MCGSKMFQDYDIKCARKKLWTWAHVSLECCQIAAVLSPPHVLVDTGSGCWNAGCRSSRSLAALELLRGKWRTQRRNQLHITSFPAARKFKMTREKNMQFCVQWNCNSIVNATASELRWHDCGMRILPIISTPAARFLSGVLEKANYSSHELCAMWRRDGGRQKCGRAEYKTRENG